MTRKKTMVKDKEAVLKYDQYEYTQEEVGKSLGSSRAAIAQLEKSAMEKFKKALLAKYDASSLKDLL